MAKAFFKGGMKMQKKRVMAMMLAAAVSVMALGGCGGREGSTNAADSAPAHADTAADTAAPLMLQQIQVMLLQQADLMQALP
jgi:hypothetical protein